VARLLYTLFLIGYCEPTYEELKLDMFRRKALPYIYCEPTYEELKLLILLSIPIAFLYCEPTYEELKQF